MIGAYDENALSGVSAVNQIMFIFIQLMLGAGDAMVAVGSQYWGQKDTASIKRVGSSALLFNFLIATLFFLCATFIPEHMVRAFTENKAMISEGVAYLHIIRFTFPLFSISSMLLAILRSAEGVKMGLRVSVMSLVINVSLNYVLIYGNLGAPELGARGAAIATLVARGAEFVVMFVYTFFIDHNRLSCKIRELIRFDSKAFAMYVKVGWRFVVVSGMFGMSTALQTAILGHMTDAAIAANSSATAIFQVLKVIAVGAASTSAIIIGKTLGEAETIEECFPRVKSYTKTLQVMYLLLGIFISVTLYFIRTPILSFYTSLSPEALELAHQFILVLCVTGFGTAYQMPVLTGIVRGGGDSKFILYNDLISIWGIVLPLSFLGAFLFHWDPVVVIFCLNSDQLFKCIPAFLKVNSYHWMKKIGALRQSKSTKRHAV